MQSSHLFNLQVVMDFDAADQTLRRRTGGQVRRKSSLGFFDLALRHFQMVCHSYLCDLEDILYILDVPFDLCPITVFGRWDLLFGQEPGQCAHHSGSGRSDDMVEGGGMLFLGLNFIKTLDSTVNAVINGLLKSFDGSLPCGALLPYNFNP